MQRIDRALLDAYRDTDRIARSLAGESRPGDERLTCQGWLANTPAKRMIYDLIYGDLLDSRGWRVLDIGGGLTALTRRLAERHRYELVDLMAHDPPDRVAAFRASCSAFEIRLSDWWQCTFTAPYDVVIANDLFPNADQRLALFLERALPIAAQVRLSLTYYNRPRFYLTRRLDAEEVLCMLAWDGAQTAAALLPFRARIAMADFAHFSATGDSVFDNGRQVVVVTLRGGGSGG